MASCKDCIHSECCFMQYGEREALKWQSQLGCKNFKDRSRFVELPCKVGDTVYRICPINDFGDCRRCPWECRDCYDLGFISDNANSIKSGKANDYNWILKRAQYFGKIYFTTKEEAEQALRKRDLNGGNKKGRTNVKFR